MLAVVDDKKKLPIPQVGERKSTRLGRRLVSQVQRRRHRPANKRGVAHLGELDEPGAVAEAAPDLGGGPDGEARLAYPARPDEADQPGARELLFDLGQLPADHFGATVPKCSLRGRVPFKNSSVMVNRHDAIQR